MMRNMERRHRTQRIANWLIPLFLVGSPRASIQAQVRELWRVVETNATQSGINTTGSAVVVDTTGQVYFLGFREITQLDGLRTEMFVAKYDPDGRLVWRCVLPERLYGLPLGGLWKCLALRPDGGVATSGSEVHPTWGNVGYVASINADGSLRWFIDSSRGAPLGGPLSSVATDNDGFICGAGPDGFVVFSSEGEWIEAGGQLEGGNVTGMHPDGGFLIEHFASYFLATGTAAGTAPWRAVSRLRGGLGATRAGNLGWYAGGLFDSAAPAEFAVVRIDLAGCRRWRSVVPGYRYDERGDHPTSSLLQAPDGTLRLVVNLWKSYFEPSAGVVVAAFAVQEPANLPEIVHGPEPVTWDGGSAVSFSVGIADPSGEQVQWYRFVDPIVGGPGEALTIPAEEVALNRGYIHAEVMNSNGVVATPVAELRLGTILLTATPPENGWHWLRVVADLGVRFAVESSTNLADWAAVPDGVGEFELRIAVQPPISGGVFYRAMELP